jgi:bifunctional pyridoxal-dependent enzyme with beta-cystathionase and maltose regulon repressor activities
VAFGPSGDGHLRLCFAASETVLAPALEKLSQGLRSMVYN